MDLVRIDMSALFDEDTFARNAVAQQIERACRDVGFFYIMGHGIVPSLMQNVDMHARTFFALPDDQKMQIAMAKGGRAWRGFFPVGGELTSGQPDNKEGLYFGRDLPRSDPRVIGGKPLHGPNLFPSQVPELQAAVLDYLNAATRASHALMEGVALSLGLDAGYFRTQYTSDPTILFRIFHYPGAVYENAEWGVGEHTDYGLLTLLAQDDIGGLQVKTRAGWIDAPPIPGSLVCNIGDMLDRLTGGVYRSTLHRVRNTSGESRISLPFFFDPGFDAEIVPLPDRATTVDDRDTRWDRTNVHEFSGTYGDYLLGKVSKVFPELRQCVI
jgi:isopenicillin N synthase-like dioxygenase